MTAGHDSLSHTQRVDALRVIIALTVLSLIVWDTPAFSWLVAPVKVLVITFHELGHVLGCLATGGKVTALMIVPDAEGHGGLTYCRGGIPVVYGQLGNLATAAFGCLFIWLGRKPDIAGRVLVGIGLALLAVTAIVMPGNLINEGVVWEGTLSMAWGIGLGCLLIFLGFKLKPRKAQLLLLFVAVQTALNAVTDTVTLIKATLGYVPGSYSDATTLSELTGVSPLVYSLAWTVAASIMLALTLWFAYLKPRKVAPAGDGYEASHPDELKEGE